MIIPKKSLGQNFLIDNNIANKIINQISIKEKVVLEIGPGYGILTDIIIEKKPKKIILIEKDDKVCEYLINKYRKIKNIEIFNTNILDYDFSHFSKIILISNLPYNISTKLILKLYKYSANVEEMLFMSREEYQSKEVEFASNINAAEENIRRFLELANAKTENELPDSLKLEVLKIREIIYPLKDELRKIRLQIRQDVNRLFQATMLVNLVCGPAFTAVILFILRGFRRRSQRMREV